MEIKLFSCVKKIYATVSAHASTAIILILLCNKFALLWGEAQLCLP